MQQENNILESNKKTVRSPNWRNPDDYAFKPNIWTKREFFAWEFLRRNPEYQKTWNKEIELYKTKKQKLNIDVDSFWSTIIPDDPSILEHWSIPWLCDPDLDTPHIFFRNCIGLNEKTASWMGVPKELLEYYGTLIIPEDMVGFLFDLRRPLDSQLKIALKKLKYIQKNLQNAGLEKIRSHDRFDDWKNYLRIYDARLENVKYKDIAQAIYNHSDESFIDRARKAFKAAKDLVNRGYIAKILKPEIPFTI